ncbi:hypothetical protein GBAR_LOCUS17430 [Geodia barretti]|uniref:Uncharacterized protein n=1 Tax=Geodia barretti TaxID=519541 RepID=A0AA35WS45_GEOBA|nr:hypothetical protein GBAR_LOCUS17430 [Geodia barretti]
MRYIGTPSGVFVLAHATTTFDWSWGHSYSFRFQSLYFEVLHDIPSCLGVPTGPEALFCSSWCTGPESQTVSTALLSLLIPVPTLSMTFPPRPRVCSLQDNTQDNNQDDNTWASFQISSILLLGKFLTTPQEKRGHVPRDIMC